MSADEPKRRRASAPQTAPYEVGYGKPPASGRFQPGRSGNPKGRPRGSKSRTPPLPALNEERLKDIILQEAYRTVQVNDPKGQLTIPMAQAIVRSLAVNAAKGHQRSQRLFTDLLGSTERDRRRQHDEWLESAISYKAEWEHELERRRVLGITGPDPLPHPDHVIVDLRAGTAHIRGPATKEEKVKWDGFLARKREFEEELEELEAMIRKPRCRHKDIIRGEIQATRRVLEIFRSRGI